MSKAAKGKWRYEKREAEVPASEFMPADMNSAQTDEWLQNSPNNWTVKLGRLVMVGRDRVQISCRTVEEKPFQYNITIDEFLRYKNEGYTTFMVRMCFVDVFHNL